MGLEYFVNMERKVKISDNHAYLEYYTERIPKRDWAKILLNYEDSVICKGTVYKLIAKDLGYGVVEISKEKKE